MLAFGLCIALFLYFLLVGSAAVRALHASRSKVQDLLIAPVVGLGLTLIPTFLINRAGLPILSFGRWLAPALPLLAVAAHLVMSRRGRDDESGELAGAPLDDALAPAPDATAARSEATWRRAVVAYLPFFAVILAGAYLTGRPMLGYGFDWLSFCNDDMANYTLAADRFLYNGFRTPPTPEMLIRGVDYAQAYWFFHVPSMSRAGSELLIALACSVTGLSAHEVFMPLIVAFHLCLVSAGAALAYTAADRRWVALLACALIAASAELTFGTIYQLIAQSSGLAILAVNILLLCRPFDGLTRGQLARHAVLVGVVLTTQLLMYPEVNPFLGAGFFVFTAVGLFRRRLKAAPLGWVLGVGGVTTLVLLNTYTYDALAFMASQGGQASQSDQPETTMFPFFLLPSGLANLWGLERIADTPPEFRLSVSIAVGGALLFVAVAAALWLAWRGEPAAAVVLVCAALAVPLFYRNVGFGLYKLAMFVQPFLLATLAVAWKRVVRRDWALPVLLLVAVPGMWRAQWNYVNFSQGGGPTFNEIVGATSQRLLQDIKRVAKVESPATASAGATPAAAIPAEPPAVIYDTYNITLSKLLAVYTRGRQAAYPSSRLTQLTLMPRGSPKTSPEAYQRQAKAILEQTWRRIQHVAFEYEPANPGAARDDYYVYDQGGRPVGRPDPDETILVGTQGNLNLLNRRHFPEAAKQPFVVTTVGAVRNYLLFRESRMSQPYYSVDDPKFISLYQIEEDPLFYKGEPMAGLGRYFLFEVIRPDEQVRVAVEMTCSLQSDGDNRLPANAAVVGRDRVPFRFVGRGSARVFSEPFAPQVVHGRPHVGVDLGRWGKQFVMRRSGAMRAFGSKVSIDRRVLVGFGRDVSLVGDEAYGRLRPPSGVTRWARKDSELRHPDLEYSGFCEDGWVAEEAFMSLGQQPGQTRLVIRGEVPGINRMDFTNGLTLKVDGRPLTFTVRQNNATVPPDRIGIGAFELSVDVPPGEGSAANGSAAGGGSRRRVEMAWSAIQKLPDPDGRPAAAKITHIAFEPPEAVAVK